MKIKVSKTFAKYVDRFVKKHRLAECAKFETVNSMDYPGGSFVGDADYDWDTDRYNVIKVYYPYEYYACPCTISTYMLMDMVRRNRIQDETGLQDALRDLIEA